MTIGIDWDAEEAAVTPTVKTTKTNELSVQSTNEVPVALKDTTPSDAVGLASVPPPVSTPVATGNPMVNQAAQAGGSMLQSLMPFVNPMHLKQGVSEYVDSSSIDPYATAAHMGVDVLGGYLGLKKVQGVGSGISRRISNVIGGVDPTIQAQINQSNKQAERAARAPQGKTPEPMATANGRIEPTLALEPPPPPAPPTTPPPPVTPVEKAALAVETPKPLTAQQQELHNIAVEQAKLKTQILQEQLLSQQNKNQPKVSGIVPAPMAAPMVAPVTPTSSTTGPAAPVVSTEVPPGTAAEVKAATVPVTPIATAAEPAALAQTVEKQAAVAEDLAPKSIKRSVPPVTLGENKGRQLPGAFSSAAAPITGEAGTSVAPTEAAVTEAKTRAAKRSPEQMAIDKAAAPEAGGKGWLTSQLGGEENYKSYINEYNQGKPYPNVVEAQKSIEANLGGPKKSEFLKAKQGITTGREKEVGPIKPNKAALEYFDKHGKLKGGVTPGMMFNIAGNALGAASLMHEYKQAKKTGDWSNFGLNAAGQIIGNVAPKLALPFALMQPGSAGESQAELQALGKRLQGAKYGAGRGSQGVPPPNR